MRRVIPSARREKGAGMRSSESSRRDRRLAAVAPKAATTARGRPRRGSETVDRRGIILDAAEALFSAHGFHGVAVRDVAAEAGVDAALLNYYYSSKRGLFDEVLRR